MGSIIILVVLPVLGILMEELVVNLELIILVVLIVQLVLVLVAVAVVLLLF